MNGLPANLIQNNFDKILEASAKRDSALNGEPVAANKNFKADAELPKPQDVPVPAKGSPQPDVSAARKAWLAELEQKVLGSTDVSAQQTSNSATNPPDAPIVDADDIPLPNVGEPEPAAEPQQAEPIANAEPAAGEDGEIAKLLETEGVDPQEAPTLVNNFKKLKTHAKTLKQELAKIKTRAEELEQTVKKYDSGEIIPERLKTLEEKASKAEHLEKLHTFRTSEYCLKEFIEPINETQQKLNELAQGYGLPPELLEEATKLPTEAELNRFLSAELDVVGAVEAKQHINRIKELRGKLAAAEKEPEQTLKVMQQQALAAKAEATAKRKNTIASIAKDSWRASIQSLQQESAMPEITYKPNDPEHNELFVKPILSKAAQEYGKIVTILAENGLEALSPELSNALAKMTVLAHASAVAAESRKAAESALTTAQRTVNEVLSLRNPGIGTRAGQGNGQAAQPAPAPKVDARGNGYSTMNTAASIVSQVLGIK